MTIQEKIWELFGQNPEWSVKELTERLRASKQMIHIALNRMMDEGKLEKIGRTPRTVYRLTAPKQNLPVRAIEEFSPSEVECLEKNWLQVTETGQLLTGIGGFTHWCHQRKLPIKKTLTEYIQTKERYRAYYRDDGLVDGMQKLQSTKGYEKIWLDNIYCLDFYAIERFGKTRLGTLLHYAKQGQNKFLMSMLMAEAAPRIRDLAAGLQVDAVGFAPPTIRRELQLMKFIRSSLKIPLPVIGIQKLNALIPVPQKSLNKLGERIINADHSFAVTEERRFNHVLLIDDAVGSGATLNQIAAKIKNKSVAPTVTGLAIVGSFKGFDVITDV